MADNNQGVYPVLDLGGRDPVPLSGLEFTSSGVTSLIVRALWGCLLFTQSAARLLLEVQDLEGSKSTGLMYDTALDKPVANTFMNRSKQKRTKAHC